MTYWQITFGPPMRAPANLGHWLMVLMLAASSPAMSSLEFVANNGDDSAGAAPVAQQSTQPTDPETFYLEDVDDGLQSACVACHRNEGVAQQSGARLVLTPDGRANHQAFSQFVALDDTDGDWVLAKVAGQEGHGGGAVLTASSPTYLALKQYLTMLGAVSGGEQSGGAFWQGTAVESRETTLRRAVLLLAGQVPSAASLSKARQSEAGLRGEITAAMSGPGFRDFIIRGANDRLLVEGLLNGLNFDIRTADRYPAIADLLVTLPEERPEGYDDYHDKPFLTRWDADWAFRWAITREPLELIAHVVMNDLSYRQVLTADHTMVNAFSDLAYRSDTGFSHDFSDASGFYDRSEYNDFRPGYNDGHIPHDQQFEANEEEGIKSFSGYQEWPHAGVLSTQAWLARYPSTDTNRNRARARWTYYHFLGVDIEKSAPRTTDPVALADTNNPTMNNSACTICHQRLDPVAGAYQSFGDLGGYLNQYGGQDSLPDAYKHPENHGGQRGSTGYVWGDTWYRDMRKPGFEGIAAAGQVDSLQWLGLQIARDPRFAAATVRFWWPAVYGADPLIAPEDDEAPDYAQHLRAFTEQEALIGKIAKRFETSEFNAKSLIADMVMAKWYRHSLVTDVDLVNARATELATVGRGRLLGPEELDRKNKAVFGRTWRQDSGNTAHDFSVETALTGFRAEFSAFYGGIDGATVTERNREITPLMSNLTEAMASELACQIVIEDFNRPLAQRLLFTEISRATVPGKLADTQALLPGSVQSVANTQNHVVELEVAMVGGPAVLRLQDMTTNSYASTDGEQTNADVVVKEVEVRQGSRVIKQISGSQLQAQRGFATDEWTDSQGRQWPRGDVRNEREWAMHETAWVEFELDLVPGEYRLIFKLGTVLQANNVNDAMRVAVSLRATENIARTPSAQAFERQIAALLTQATHREATRSEMDELMAILLSSADDALQHGSWFNSHNANCATWAIWPDEDLSDEAYFSRYSDPDGMLRGWSTLIHGVLTSYGYLHD